MMILALLVAAALTYTIGRGLVRVLGWPRDLESAMRWAIALVVVAVVYSGLPELLALARPLLPDLPGGLLSVRVPFPEVLAGLGLAGLGVLGFIAWKSGLVGRDAHERGDADTRHDVRKRALPPPPKAAPHTPGFIPLGQGHPPDNHGD